MFERALDMFFGIFHEHWPMESERIRLRDESWKWIGELKTVACRLPPLSRQRLSRFTRIEQ
jgi:hypothetical protein